MDTFFFSWSNVVIGLVILLPLALALAKLFTSPMAEAARLFWAIIVLLVPVIGPLAFLLAKVRAPDRDHLT